MCPLSRIDTKWHKVIQSIHFSSSTLSTSSCLYTDIENCKLRKHWVGINIRGRFKPKKNCRFCKVSLSISTKMACILVFLAVSELIVEIFLNIVETYKHIIRNILNDRVNIVEIFKHIIRNMWNGRVNIVRIYKHVIRNIWNGIYGGFVRCVRVNCWS